MEEVQKTDAENEAELLAIMAEDDKNINSPDSIGKGCEPLAGFHKGFDLGAGGKAVVI